MGFKIKEVSHWVWEDSLGYIVDSTMPRDPRLNKTESVSSEDISLTLMLTADTV